jgi:hypothetical protein
MFMCKVECACGRTYVSIPGLTPFRTFQIVMCVDDVVIFISSVLCILYGMLSRGNDFLVWSEGLPI